MAENWLSQVYFDNAVSLDLRTVPDNPYYGYAPTDWLAHWVDHDNGHREVRIGTYNEDHAIG